MILPKIRRTFVAAFVLLIFLNVAICSARLVQVVASSGGQVSAQ